MRKCTLQYHRQPYRNCMAPTIKLSVPSSTPALNSQLLRSSCRPPPLRDQRLPGRIDSFVRKQLIECRIIDPVPEKTLLPPFIRDRDPARDLLAVPLEPLTARTVILQLRPSRDRDFSHSSIGSIDISVCRKPSDPRTTGHVLARISGSLSVSLYWVLIYCAHFFHGGHGTSGTDI